MVISFGDKNVSSPRLSSYRLSHREGSFLRLGFLELDSAMHTCIQDVFPETPPAGE